MIEGNVCETCDRQIRRRIYFGANPTLPSWLRFSASVAAHRRRRRSQAMAEQGTEEEKKGKEGKNLLGPPTFTKLENDRFKCVETGHELPANGLDSYAQTKHCRQGLIDAALANNKPPLNMFLQDNISRSKLVCKLTGVMVNKSEEHIWKHINGKRFLKKLEEKEAEKLTPKSNGMVKEKREKITTKMSKPNVDIFKKKKKKQGENADKVISEAKSSDKESDPEETDFWVPPVGDRWDLDNGGDRWGSGSESEPETEDANGIDTATEEGDNDAREHSKRMKRTSIEIGPSKFASRKKKKKTKSK